MGRRGRRWRIGEKSADITDTMTKGTTQRTAARKRTIREFSELVAALNRRAGAWQHAEGQGRRKFFF